MVITIIAVVKDKIPWEKRNEGCEGRENHWAAENRSVVTTAVQGSVSGGGCCQPLQMAKTHEMPIFFRLGT